ncbi:hypothetical protein CHS0354_025918 [Potamilus streckersoni]|uniref:Uncharacterized protein n=1 Tax=Potamilus streckersoni TaxID=2493646 RepID=A0AAE0W5Y2_9BIVA|nr:hypothetical protein CHS0354_025918 [Potamilus streckersoni]
MSEDGHCYEYCWAQQERETPLLVYIGLVFHTKTRKYDLVDTIFDFALPILYNLVLNTSTYLENNIFQLSVRMLLSRVGLLTTCTADNIEFNFSSTSALGSFHGIEICLFQHSSDELQTEKGENMKSTDRWLTDKAILLYMPAF